MIILDDASENIASGSMNVQSSEYGMILPAVVFEMNRQSGDSSGVLGPWVADQLMNHLMMNHLMMRRKS